MVRGWRCRQPPLASTVQEGIPPAESCCPTHFHTLLGEKPSYKAVYFSQITPPVNKIPQSPTFKLDMPPLPFPGKKCQREDFRSFPGAGGQRETSQEVSSQPQNSTMGRARGCVPAALLALPRPQASPVLPLPGARVPWPPAHLLTPGKTLETACLSRFLPPPPALVGVRDGVGVRYPGSCEHRRGVQEGQGRRPL